MMAKFPVSFDWDGEAELIKRGTYRLGDRHFSSIIDAENARLDSLVRAPIEFHYKGRWHEVGGRPEAERVSR